VPESFFAALTANESGGKPDAKRFEPKVFANIAAVLVGEQAKYGSLDAAAILGAISAQIRRPGAISVVDWELKPVYDAIHALADVEIKKSGAGSSLSLPEDRLVRIFTRSRSGSRCELAQMSAGLSDARVLRIRVFDESGATRINAIAKIGSHEAIALELKNYEKEISRLDPKAL